MDGPVLVGGNCPRQALLTKTPSSLVTKAVLFRTLQNLMKAFFGDGDGDGDGNGWDGGSPVPVCLRSQESRPVSWWAVGRRENTPTAVLVQGRMLVSSPDRWGTIGKSFRTSVGDAQEGRPVL